MTKSDLVERLHSMKELPALSKRELHEITDAMIQEIVRSIKKDKKFTLPNFGTFQLKKRKARMGRNPRTGEAVPIAPFKTITFRPAPALKDSI